MGQHHPRRRLTVAATAALAALAFAGCAEAQAVPERPSQDLTDARAFDEFRLFFAGLGQGDSRLTFPGIDANNPYYAGRPVVFGYGFCNPSGSEHNSCSLPIQIANYPAHAENLGRYRGMVRPVATTCMRGVRVGVFGRGEAFDKLLLSTGWTTVAVRAPTLRAARSLLARLRSVDGRVRPTGLLPRPAARLKDRAGRPCPR
jgi:hypothetical protein